MINKSKNKNLQLTLSNADYERLEQVNDLLNTLLGVNLTKSQAVAFLIRNYGNTPLNKSVDVVKPRQPRASKDGVNYQAQIIALKDKLNVSYTRLSQIIGIPPSTLKKYASGTQQPTNDNLTLLNEALSKYGIK